MPLWSAAADDLPALPAAPGGTRALVWLKRDLRARDHAPLRLAATAETAAALYIIEPEQWADGAFAPQHLAFALATLAPLREALHARGMPLLVRVGSAVPVLQQVREQFAFTHLLSHEETGAAWTYARDIAVGQWCAAAGVHWLEATQTGVVRRLRSRTGWAGRWQARMDAAIVPPPDAWPGWRPGFEQLGALPTLSALHLPAVAQPLPDAGESSARALLKSFLASRGRGYRRGLSSPNTAPETCSRLSAHLAIGSLSMRTVHQASERAIALTEDRTLASNLRAFTGRLRWHCHFMQKLEDEPSIEWRNFARSYDGLRPGDEGVAMAAEDEAKLAAWKAGRTGFPMVDACMRALNATGWINFRMRAMLVSFAAYQLWLHWRLPGLHLAQQFLDYEPGIHWSQMQMQSGTTGINTLRMYSPAKQMADHDPDGVFVRRWVPEWGTPDYPAPIVDERAALANAKTVLYGLRKHDEVREEADAVQQRHGSRKSGLPQTGQKRAPAAGPRRPARRGKTPATPSPQQELFE
ncbi:cryptochrome/deoxyribodipyrimidine photo-lyase family protein [Piscinibacterium candidicorallinum]|uniref:Deoxyribodipyrimidine photo-lyase/cryptochrome family protein n=1 Tax=Piscinibacterium candidicorallinum TaxID=1793872 RepID=A0ABV7H5X4_9BURK